MKRTLAILAGLLTGKAVLVSNDQAENWSENNSGN
jgi:hypothetical protein